MTNEEKQAIQDAIVAGVIEGLKRFVDRIDDPKGAIFFAQSHVEREVRSKLSRIRATSSP